MPLVAIRNDSTASMFAAAAARGPDGLAGGQPGLSLARPGDVLAVGKVDPDFAERSIRVRVLPRRVCQKPRHVLLGTSPRRTAVQQLIGPSPRLSCVACKKCVNRGWSDADGVRQ